MTEVRVHFDNLEDIIIQELKSAKKKVRVAVAWINFNLYSKTFKKLLNNGVALQIVITDNLFNQRYSNTIEELIIEGATIKLLNMPKKSNFMHHKFCVIDNKTVLTGSFNWTANAKNNFENLVVIKNMPHFQIEKMIQEFKLLLNMDTKDILKLQGLEKCKKKNCKGRVSKVLVYDPLDDDYGSMRSYLLGACTDNSEHVHVIEEDLETSNLYFEMQGIIENFENQIDELVGYENERSLLIEELDYRLEQCFEKDEFNGYTVNAVGIKGQETIDMDGDTEVIIKILWKNRFITSAIEDTIYFDF